MNANSYAVSYKNNKNAGAATVTIKGKKGFTGETVKYFTIKQRSLSKCKVTLEKKTYKKTGKAIKPKVIVKIGKINVPRSSYTVIYKNNVKKGTGKVVIKGKKNLFGKVTKTFKIV